MGGKAFSNGTDPLITPRMPANVYFRLKSHYLSILSTLYAHVATPIEAPSKSSYGDIDILVSEPKTLSATTIEVLQKSLSAERRTSSSSSPTISFAVPYPDLPNNYVQLDVHTCPPSTFHWQLFHQSHGDLWNLLGTTIRSFGLTANDAGLHLRIEEIEAHNRKRSMVFLTADPDAVLELLGMDRETYQRPFGSVEDMYAYVVSCRFFRRERYVREGLKANDRKRLAQRELFRRFVESWLPENEDWLRAKEEREPNLSKEDVKEMVLKRFGKKSVYETVVKEWRGEREELERRKKSKEERRAHALEAKEHANAWIESINQRR
ncbi:hypothetical protein ACLMJK_001227 [Lecanora helva]